jgi:hypothetical protein
LPVAAPLSDQPLADYLGGTPMIPMHLYPFQEIAYGRARAYFSTLIYPAGLISGTT